LRGDRPQRSVEYAWPLHRQLSNSGDFLYELSQMVRAFGGAA
jgi:hypothetical protein